MNNAHEISEEAANAIRSALSNNGHWLAHSNDRYFLGRGDLYFFKSGDEANEFAISNISDRESFHVIHFESLEDVYQKILYAEKLRIDPDANPLHDHDGDAFTDALIEHIEEQQFSNNQKQKFMNEQNFDYLKNQLKYTGFGEEMGRELRENISQQAPNFTMMHKANFGDDKVEAALQFKKSEQSDMYFLNSYILQLKNEKGEENFTQSFRVGRENNITLKEAYNMMNGRAIHKEMTPKEGEKYHAWLQLNFKETDERGDFKMKQFHQNYGYDLKQTLGKYPIKELENPEHAQSLIKSLERGNRQSVTMLYEGKEQKMFIEASPQFKSLNIFNSENLRVNVQTQSQSEKQSQSQTQTVSEKQTVVEKNTEKQSEGGSEKKSKKQTQKESAGTNEEAGKQKQTRRQKQHIS